jgi:hypothetical protein
MKLSDKLAGLIPFVGVIAIVILLASALYFNLKACGISALFVRCVEVAK